MIQYLVRHELYETAANGFGRVLVQEWEEKHWMPDFHAVGEFDYVNGDKNHTTEIVAKYA